MPRIPMHHVGDPDPAVLDKYADCFVQNDVGAGVMLGGMMGYKLDMSTPPEHGHVLIHNLLRAV